MNSYICEHCGVMLSPADDPHNCLAKQPGLKNGSREEHGAAVRAGMSKNSWRCTCGILWKATKAACGECGATRPEEHRESVKERPTLRDLEMGIIECAVQWSLSVNTSEESDAANNLNTAIEIYHHELRRLAREET